MFHSQDLFLHFLILKISNSEHPLNSGQELDLEEVLAQSRRPGRRWVERPQNPQQQEEYSRVRSDMQREIQEANRIALVFSLVCNFVLYFFKSGEGLTTLQKTLK